VIIAGLTYPILNSDNTIIPNFIFPNVLTYVNNAANTGVVHAEPINAELIPYKYYENLVFINN
jgi:hypothetical protein